MHPQELLPLVLHPNQPAEAWVFLLQPCVQLPQDSPISADRRAALQLRPVTLCIPEFSSML